VTIVDNRFQGVGSTNYTEDAGVNDRRVSIEVPGWTLEQKQGLDFLMEDAGIVGTWANDEVVVVSPADAGQIRKFVEFLGATTSADDVAGDASSAPVSHAWLPPDVGSEPVPESAA
jgi:hypothetical protein